MYLFHLLLFLLPQFIYDAVLTCMVIYLHYTILHIPLEFLNFKFPPSKHRIIEYLWSTVLGQCLAESQLQFNEKTGNDENVNAGQNASGFSGHKFIFSHSTLLRATEMRF